MSIINIQQLPKESRLSQHDEKNRKKLKYQNIQLHKQIFELEKQVNEFFTKNQAKQLKNQQLQKQLTLLYGQQLQDQEKKIRKLKEQVYYLKSSNAKTNVQYINKEQSELLLLIKERNELLREKQLFKNSIQDKKQVLQQKNNGLDEHKIGLESQYNKTKKTNQKYMTQIGQLERQVRKFHFLAESTKQQQNVKIEVVDTQSIELQIIETSNLIFQAKKEIKDIEDKWKTNIDSLNTEYFTLASEQKEKRQIIQNLQKEIKNFQHRANSLRDETDIDNDRNRLAKVKAVNSTLGFSRSFQKKQFKNSRVLQQSTPRKEKMRSQFLLKELQNIKVSKRNVQQKQKIINLNFYKNSPMKHQSFLKTNLVSQKQDEKVSIKEKNEKLPSKSSELKIPQQKLQKVLIEPKAFQSKDSKLQSKQKVENKTKTFPSKSLKELQKESNDKGTQQKIIKKKDLKPQSAEISMYNSCENNYKRVDEKPKRRFGEEDEQRSQKIAKNKYIGSSISLKSKKIYSSQKFAEKKENESEKISLKKDLKQEIEAKQHMKKIQQSKNKKIPKQNSSTDNIIEKVSEKSIQKFYVKLQNKISPNKKRSNEENVNSDKKQKDGNYSSQVAETQKKIKIQKNVQNSQKQQQIPSDNKVEVKQEVFKPYLIKRRKRPEAACNFQIVNGIKNSKQNLLLLIQKQSIGVGNQTWTDLKNLS